MRIAPHVASIATVVAILLGAACSKREKAPVPAGSVPPSKSAAPAAPEKSVPPAGASTLGEPVRPAAPAVAKTETRASSSKPDSPKSAASTKASAERAHVRSGPLAGLRRLDDYLATARAGRTTVKITLHNSEEWIVREPRASVALTGIPNIDELGWLHVRGEGIELLAPISAVASMTLEPISSSKDKAKASITARDGATFSGLVEGTLWGVHEIGSMTIPWRTIARLEIAAGEGVSGPDPLPLKGNISVVIDDEAAQSYTSWATVVGDVISDVLLVESGTGPATVALKAGDGFDLVSTDRNAFFFANIVATRDPTGTETRHNVGLHSLLLQRTNGWIMCVRPPHTAQIRAQ